MSGCAGILDPQGPVGVSERLVLIDSLAIMLAIVIPVIAATIGFAWWFRASNTRAYYRPDWAFSGRLELIVWAIPTLVITFLGGIAWFGSHALDPFKPLESQEKTIEVEVVSLDWRWLFIYPDQHVATINQLVIPTGVPVHFKLTSATVMNSFFVPQLGSQIYAMAGMTSQLHLQADRPGTYRGISAQFSGDEFADMTFEVKAMPGEGFAAWVKDTAATGPTLDAAAYAQLVALSQASPKPLTFRAVQDGLFETILGQTMKADTDPAGATPPASDQTPKKGT